MPIQLNQEDGGKILVVQANRQAAEPSVRRRYHLEIGRGSKQNASHGNGAGRSSEGDNGGAGIKPAGPMASKPP